MTQSSHFPAGQALIIGGSGGIGRAVCEAIAGLGSDIALTWRNNAKGAEETAEALRALDVRCSIHQLDAIDLDAVRETCTRIREIGPIHTLVNAAGASIPMQWISKLDPVEWAEVMNADINGVYNIVHSVLPHLRETAGAFVQVSSAGLVRYPTRDILSVAPKAAIEALVKGIAREEGRHGVRANSVGVGVVEAGMFLRLKETHFNDEWIQAATQNAALKRFGTAQEVADVVAFLASRRASYVTGQFIAVDGGYTV